MADKKILVIDDDQDVLDSISAVLSSKGYKVITAIDGNGGVNKFKSEKPDMVLCDMMMEKVDAGIKTAKIIRDENSKVPIYLLSSIGEATSNNVSISEIGFNGVLQKPVDPDTLIAQIKKVLGS